MKKFKNVVKLLGLVVVTSCVLTACGSNKNSTTSKKDEPIQLRISWWGGDDRHKATLEAIKKFEEKNPKIKVKAEYSGWDGVVEKMATQIAGGTEADVMQLNFDWYATYSKDGTGFADLNEYKDIIDMSGYSDDTLSVVNIKGKLNGIPFGENASIIGLNKTIYDKFGVDVKNLKTWDDYIEAAKKFPEGYYPLYSTGLEGSYVTQKTGKSKLDNEGNVNWTVDELAEGLEWNKKMIDAKVIPSYEKTQETVGTSHLATTKEFIDGNYASFDDWAGGVGTYASVLKEAKMDLYIPSYPTLVKGQNAGVTKKPTMLFSISKNSKHPKEAAKLLNFLLNDPDGVKVMGTTRGMPANKNAVKILEENNLIDETSKEAAEFVNNTSGIQESPYLEMSQISEAYDGPSEAFKMGQIDAKTAAKQIIEDTEAAIKEIKAQ